MQMEEFTARIRQVVEFNIQKGEQMGKSGVLERVFIALQKEQIIQIKIKHVSLDSTSIKVHPVR
jgi:hypothetical protein